MNWKQFLTEKVLKECWHSSSLTIHNDTSGQCKKCGTMLYIIGGANRTFTTRNDLMDLYQKVYEDWKWTELVKYLNNIWWIKYGRLYDTVDEAIADYNAWLFCLNGKNYETRCKMVAEFYGWEDEK